jgi:WD40 repeat protein
LGFLGLILIPATCRANEPIQLVAGKPKVLEHPPINKSIGNPVHCLAFVDGGAALATGATSGVFVWDVESGERRQTLDVDERGVDALLLDSQGTRLVAGGASGIIKVFDAQTFKLLNTLGPTPGAVRGLAISPDGKLLASASPNGQLGKADRQFGIMIWDLVKAELRGTIPHPPPEFGMTLLAFLPEGNQILTAQDRTFRVLDIEKREVIRTIDLPDLPRTLGSIALSRDGRRLITGAFEPAIRIWDTQSFEQLLTWDAHEQKPPPERGAASVNVSPDGRFVLSGGMDGMVCVWDASSGRRLLELDGRGEDSGRWITGVAMSPNGRWLAATHYGGTATIWRITDKK